MESQIVLEYEPTLPCNSGDRKCSVHFIRGLADEIQRDNFEEDEDKDSVEEEEEDNEEQDKEEKSIRKLSKINLQREN